MRPLKPPKLCLLGVKVTPELIRQLDQAALAAGRTRSGEVRVRLEQSLARLPRSVRAVRPAAAANPGKA
jgi:hypothetical protein